MRTVLDLLRAIAPTSPSRRSIDRRTWLAGACGAALAATAGRASASTLAEADNSREAREEAIRALPLQRLQPAAQQRVSAVANDATIYRRLPLEMIACDAELFVFLVRYPEVVVDMWRVMGVTQINVQRVADYVVRANDGAGTVTDIELLYGTPGLHLIQAEGEYAGPLFRRRMKGRCVLMLRSGYKNDAEGRTRVTNQLDVFLQVDNMGAELAARTMQNMIGRTADQNFVESSRFIEQVCLQSEANTSGMQRLANRLKSVTPPVRSRFTEIVSRVGELAEQRDLGLAEPSERAEAPTERIGQQPGAASIGR